MNTNNKILMQKNANFICNWFQLEDKENLHCNRIQFTEKGNTIILNNHISLYYNLLRDLKEICNQV